MDNNRPNNSRKPADRKNQDENKPPSQQTSGKNGVRAADKRADPAKKQTETAAAAAVQAKGPQATAEQLRMAQMSQVASASDVQLAERIKQVRELTGCSEDDAVTALHDSNNDPEAAVNLVLEGGANKSEWETTGKKGKKKPKAKPEETTNDSTLLDTQFGGYVSSSKINNTSNRGRPAQRNTSSRGGRGGAAAASAPRSSQQDDSNCDGANHRTFPPTADRPLSPKAGRPSQEDGGRGRGAADGKRPEQERLWGEDADDDWKDGIRETKVFTRSAPAAASSNSSFPQQGGPARVPQPAVSVGSSGPSFSAMVQKQSQQAAWTNSNAPPGPATNAQRLPVTDAASWKQPPAVSNVSAQKPPAPNTVPEHSVAVGGTVPSTQPHATASIPVQKDSPADLAQVGLQFGNLSFNRSYDARTGDQSNQAPAPSHSQTYNSRPAFNQSSRDQAPGEQTTPHRPAPATHPSHSPNDSSRPQNASGLGGSAFVPPAQTLSFGHSDQDAHTNSYSAKNIQSSTIFTGSQQAAQGLPSRSPGANFTDQRSGPAGVPPSSAQHQTLSQANSNTGATSAQDSRFSQQQQQPAAAANVLSKSPQAPPGRTGDQSAFGPPQQQQPQKPLISSSSQSSNVQTDQFPQHQPLPTIRQQTGGYGSYGLSSDTGPRNSYSAFSGQPAQSAVASLNAGQKDGSAGLQQQQSGNLSTTASAAPRTAAAATSVFNTGSKPSPVSQSSMNYKQSTYPTQSNLAPQSVLSQQQQYLQQGQQYGQQSTVPIFNQMYSTTLDPMNDPRMQSVMQPGMGLEYSSYANSLPSRDTSGLGGYSTSDPNKYRTDPMQQSQVSQQQQQQGLAPHLPQSGPYQSYMYTPAAVAQNYGYAQTPVYPSSIPGSGYGKATGSLGSSYLGSGYQAVPGLGEVNKLSNAYGAAGLRGFGNDGYLGNQGLLTGTSDLQQEYYGNKAGNKFDNKPTQNFGMHLPGGQQAASAYSAGQYYPNAMMQQQQQQQMHQMGQLPQNSAGQNLGNNSNKPPQQQQQSKGSNQSSYQSWGHQ